ncbi:MAG: polysaccharide deacetylase family protein [Armatimonadota bacterium]
MLFRQLPIGILILLLFGACFLPLPARAADSLDTLDRTLGLLESGDVDAAHTTLATLQGNEANDSLVLATQGIADLQSGKFPQAEMNFRLALSQDPRQLTALWGLSLCLLQNSCAFEAVLSIDYAASVAPKDTRVKVLQAYAYLLLGRTRDAAEAGKAALEGGDKSPFLLAVLAEIHRKLGYAQKALEFGSLSAKYFYGMDYLAKRHQVNLPLTMLIADTPDVLSGTAEKTEKPDPRVQRTDLEIGIPTDENAANADKTLQITSPQPNVTVRGIQRVQAAYRGTEEIKFVIFLVDKALRGLTTEIPYHFQWDADASTPGEHTLTIRVYDYRGIQVDEDAVTVTTVTGKVIKTAEPSTRAMDLQRRMMTLTMPDPAPLSLFTRLGWWHQDLKETEPAILAFEKAAAIDPTAEGVLDNLAKLYQQNGLHDISTTGEVKCGPVTGKRRVALTFDDGPNPMYTSSILSELERYEARATFFLVGKRVQQYPDLALQILAEGHELANHTYTHPNLTKLTRNEIIAEVLRNRATIKDVTGQQTYLFRPPGGQIDEFVTKQLRALDYNIIYWNINAGEYSKMTPANQSAAIVNKTQDGSIILLHNGPVDGTLSILPILLNELHRRGFTFVTVSELMKEN